MTTASAASSVAQATTLDTALATLITKATTGIDAGVSFLSAQLPDVIHQLLLWEAVSKITNGLFLLTPLIVAIYIWFKNKTILFKYNHDGISVFFVITSFVSVVATVWSVISFMKALKVIIAPKLFLIEYAANLIK